MNNIQSHTTCDNPACGRELVRRDAFLRSVSLVQRAFCSVACVDVFDRLDKASRVPVQRRPVVSVPDGTMGA